MATPATITPAAVLAQNRHQGGLREYVNQRLAPYIKKALKDAEAQMARWEKEIDGKTLARNMAKPQPVTSVPEPVNAGQSAL